MSRKNFHTSFFNVLDCTKNYKMANTEYTPNFFLHEFIIINIGLCMHAVIKTFFSVEVRGIILMARGVWNILFCKLKFSKGEAGPEFPFRFSYGDKIGHYGIGMNQKKKKIALNSEWLTLPCERAPITTTTGSFSGTMSRGLVTFSTWNDVPYFLQPRGRWSLTGFLMTWKQKRTVTYTFA